MTCEAGTGATKSTSAAGRAETLPYDTSLESATIRNFCLPAMARRSFIAPTTWLTSAAGPSKIRAWTGMPPSAETASPAWICFRSVRRSLGCP
nr:hypothetical protein [Streptomyces adelaidensis]